MARYWLATTASPLPALALASIWGSSTSAPFRGKLTSTKGTSGNDQRWSKASTTAGKPDTPMAQFVSDPLAAGTLSGAFKCYTLAYEEAAAANYKAQIHVRVVSGDGSVERGVLYAGDTSADLSSEFNPVNFQVRSFPTKVFSPVAVTPVNAEAGDRLVVEIGYRPVPTYDGNRWGYISFGESGANCPETESTGTGSQGTPSYAAWFDIGATTTPVNQNLAVSWNVTTRVGKSLAGSWNVAGAIAGRSLTASWNNVGFAREDVGLIWNTRLVVGASSALRWNVKATPWPRFHPSSPPRELVFGPGALAATSDEFTAPSYSLLVACVTIGSGNVTDVAAYSSVPLTWAQEAYLTGPVTVAIFTAPYLEGGPVTVTGAAFITSGTAALSVKTYVLTDADLVNPVGANATLTSSGDPTSIEYTSVADYSRPIAVAVDSGTRELTSPDVYEPVAHVNPPLYAASAYTAQGSGPAGDTASVTFDPAVGSGTLYLAAVEIRAAYLSGTGLITVNSSVAGEGLRGTGLITTISEITGEYFSEHLGTTTLTSHAHLAARGGQAHQGTAPPVNSSALVTQEGAKSVHGYAAIVHSTRTSSTGVRGLAGEAILAGPDDSLTATGTSARSGNGQITGSVTIGYRGTADGDGTGVIPVDAPVVSGDGVKRAHGISSIDTTYSLNAVGTIGYVGQITFTAQPRVFGSGGGHRYGTTGINTVAIPTGPPPPADIYGPVTVTAVADVTGIGEKTGQTQGALTATAILTVNGIKTGEGVGTVDADTDVAIPPQPEEGIGTLDTTVIITGTGGKNLVGDAVLAAIITVDQVGHKAGLGDVLVALAAPVLTGAGLGVEGDWLVKFPRADVVANGSNLVLAQPEDLDEHYLRNQTA